MIDLPLSNSRSSTCGDVDSLGAGALERGHVDLVVEVADIAEDGLVLHRLHVIGVMMSLLPVDVMTMSAVAMASSTVRRRSPPSGPAAR